MSYSITKPPVLVEAWGQQSTVSTDYIVPPQSGSSTVQTQDYGWTPIYQEDLPPVGSGLPLTRQQMNGVLNLYSSHDFWLQAGGTYTFEQDISDACTGYPAGQVLWCAANKSWQVSLVNNNTVNFITTPSAINDGTNWQQVNQAHGFVSYEAAGTYTFTIPLGVRQIIISATGGGGGGGAGASFAGGGGSGGAGIANIEYSVTPGSTLTIVIGAGGAGGSGTSFGQDGNPLTITGGVSLTLAGGPGGSSGANGIAPGGKSGNGIDGGPGVYVASLNLAMSGLGGGSVFCPTLPGDASLTSSSANGQSGYSGAGGAGGLGSDSGGNGADGAILITY